MKPAPVSTPGRIYRRGQLLRKCYQYDQQKYYLNRILMPELEKKRILDTHRRTISQKTARSRSIDYSAYSPSRTIQPLRMVVSRCLEDQSEQMRKRKQSYWAKFKLGKFGKDSEYKLPLPQTGTLRTRREYRELKSKYDFLLEPKSCRIFN